jgi:hypothetical protein
MFTFRFTATTFCVPVPCPLAAAATVSRGRRLASAAARGGPNAAKNRRAVKRKCVPVAGPDLDGITGEQIAKLRNNYDKEPPQLMICVEQETDVTLSEMILIGKMSEYFKDIQIRVFKHDGKQHMCKEHKPIFDGNHEGLDLAKLTNIRLLVGGKPEGDMGKFEQEITLSDNTAVDLYHIPEQSTINMCVHVCQESLDSRHRLRDMLEELMTEITRGNKRSQDKYIKSDLQLQQVSSLIGFGTGSDLAPAYLGGNGGRL